MKRWIICPKKSSDIIEQLLINRNIPETDWESFLNPNYDRDLHDPSKFRDMKKAVKRIITAIKNKEKIGIFADYDADGIPGAAILYKIFTLLNASTEVYIPTREEGYGLNESGINELNAKGCKIIITVDLGIVNKKEVEFAQKLKMDVIVTDHHEIQPAKLPGNAYAIIHPRLNKQKYPFGQLAGGAVAWKLGYALLATYEVRLVAQMKWLLDLAAISTICDIVPLIGENRVLVKYGLIVLQKTKNLGLKKLYDVASIKPEIISTYNVGFQIGPRINAPGRMDNASASFYLLTSVDNEEALKIARNLNQINLDRQAELDRVLKEAEEKITKRGLHKKKIILVEGKNWPEGIVGLVAGRLMEKFARPTIVLGEHKDGYKGSARSIDEFHLLESLEASKEYLSKFGGHARAAGLSLEREHLSNLYDRLLELAEAKLEHKNLVPKISIDAEIKLEDINQKLYDKLKKFEPFGMTNPRPVFLLKELIISSLRTVGADGKHLKLKLQAMDAIGFDLGYLAEELTEGEKIDIVFTIDINEWNNQKKLQLKIIDLRKGEKGDVA